MTSLSSNPPSVPSPMRSKTSLDSGPSETKRRLDRAQGPGGDVDPVEVLFSVILALEEHPVKGIAAGKVEREMLSGPPGSTLRSPVEGPVKFHRRQDKVGCPGMDPADGEYANSRVTSLMGLTEIHKKGTPTLENDPLARTSNPPPEGGCSAANSPPRSALPFFGG